MIDFLGLGAMKAGSSWQRRWLATHPDIFIAPEELHFWEGRKQWSLDEYLANFAGAGEGQRVGEITPAYAIMDEAQIAAVHDHNPALRLFYCLRNPIDRVWAHIRMGHDQGRLDLTRASHDEIVALFERDKWQRAGAYTANIARWSRRFGPESLHLFLFEDIVAAPVATLAELARHIGVDPGHFESMPETQAATLADPVFAAEPIPVPASVLGYLRAEFAEEVARVGDLVGRDLSDWIADPACARIVAR